MIYTCGINWFEQQENSILKQMQEQTEYLFGVTHYDWMYRTTGNKKYLDEQKKYIEKHSKLYIKKYIFK